MVSSLVLFAVILILNNQIEIVAGLRFVFVAPHDNITLKCNAESYENWRGWYGPSHNNANDVSMVKIDINQRWVQWNVSRYTDNFKVYSFLPHFQRLRIGDDTANGRHDLQIMNVSLNDEGLYFCDLANKPLILLAKALPSDLKVNNRGNLNIATGIANQPMNLTCSVTRHIPIDNLEWIYKGRLLKRGGHGVIHYVFNPGKDDDGKNFKCEGKNYVSNETLTKTIKLNIQYAPDLYVVDNSKDIICCYSTGNPPVKVMSWYKDGEVILREFNTSTICFPVTNINRSRSRHYICEAINEIGNRSKDVYIKGLHRQGKSGGDFLNTTDHHLLGVNIANGANSLGNIAFDEDDNNNNETDDVKKHLTRQKVVEELNASFSRRNFQEVRFGSISSVNASCYENSDLNEGVIHQYIGIHENWPSTVEHTYETVNSHYENEKLQDGLTYYCSRDL